MPKVWRPPFHTFDSKEKLRTPRVFFFLMTQSSGRW